MMSKKKHIFPCILPASPFKKDVWNLEFSNFISRPNKAKMALSPNQNKLRPYSQTLPKSHEGRNVNKLVKIGPIWPKAQLAWALKKWENEGVDKIIFSQIYFIFF